MVRETEPLVSIIIPVYNAGGFLQAAVESVIDQYYKNLQIIIVDDGSTDHCIETLQHFSDNRITILRQKNSGKSIAVNNALHISCGKYYAIQDADDISTPDRITVLVDFMEENPDIAAVFSGHDLLVDSTRFAPVKNEKDRHACKTDIDQIRMPAHDPTAMYRLSMVEEIRYDPELKIGQGYDYILQVGEKYPMWVVDDCLYSYRIRDSSTTRGSNTRRAMAVKNVWKKACNRRGIDFNQWLSSNKPRLTKLEREANRYGLIAHCMESVVTSKVKNKYLDALKVGVLCCRLNPFKLNYYKPMIYSLTPLKLIHFYRNRLKELKHLHSSL